MTLFFSLLVAIAALIVLRLTQEYGRARKDEGGTDYIVVDHATNASWGSQCGCFARPSLIPTDPEEYARHMAPSKGNAK